MRKLARSLAVAAALAAVGFSASPATAEPAAVDILLPVETLNETFGFGLDTQVWELSTPGDNDSAIEPQQCWSTANARTGQMLGDPADYHAWAHTDGGDEHGHQHTVTQSIAIYPTAESAASVMAALAEAVRSCGQQTYTTHGSDGEHTWVHTVDKIEKTALRHHGVYADLPDWRCVASTRLQGRAVTQSSLCEDADPDSPAEIQAQDAAADRLAGLLVSRSR